MNVTREDLNPCTVKLNIVCEPGEVKEAFDKAYKTIAKNIRLPGFRPGHAPRAMVEPMIGINDLKNEAGDFLVRKLGNKAIEQEELKPDPSQSASVEVIKLEKEPAEFEFSVKVALPPIVDLGEYKGIPVEKPSTEVSDEEIEYQLDELRKRKSTRRPITDRGVEESDVAVVNVKVEGQEGDGRTFMTVVGQTFPQLDEALMGMRVEEIKHVDLTFPENFQEKDWAGKSFKCVVSINSLSSVQLPELDEEFAKSLKTENVDELKTKLRETISRAKESMVRDIVNRNLLTTLLERSTVHVPDNMWENIAARRLQEIAMEQRQKGETFEDYAKERNMSTDELVEEWKQTAHNEVKRAILIREVFAREKMQITEMDLNQELFAMAHEYEIQPDELINILKKNNQIEEIHFRAIARKVSDFLRENAEMKEAVTA